MWGRDDPIDEVQMILECALRVTALEERDEEEKRDAGRGAALGSDGYCGDSANGSTLCTGGEYSPLQLGLVDEKLYSGTSGRVMRALDDQGNLDRIDM
jgi:hypothetical protein